MDNLGNILLSVIILTVFMMPIPAFENNTINNEIIKDIACSQPIIDWDKTYGDGDNFEMLNCVQQTNDGGYISCGVKQADDMDDVYRPWVLCVDANGDELWEWEMIWMEYEGNYFNHFEDCYCSFISQIADGGYIVCLGVECSTGEEVYWVCGLAKLSNSGEEEWIKHYTEWYEWSLHPRSLLELTDGSLVVTGLSGNYGIEDDLYACLLKTDSSGKEQWMQEYNYGDGDDQSWGVCQTNNNGYLVTGWSTSNEKAADYWMIKTDDNGVEEWSNTFGGVLNDFGHSCNCYQTLDNGYIMCGYGYSFGAGRTDAWIVKTDSSGEMVWNKTYGESGMDVCWSGTYADDDGFVFCVTKNINGVSGDKDDIHIIKIDSYGNIEWVQQYGGADLQIGQYIYRTQDNGYIVSGRTGKYFSSSSDGLLVKFSSFENSRPDKPITPIGSERGATGSEYTYSTSSSDGDDDQIYYMWDWGDGNFSTWLGPYNADETCEAVYTWSHDGSYSIRVMGKDSNGGESDWSDSMVVSMPYNHMPILDIIRNLFNWFITQFLSF